MFDVSLEKIIKNNIPVNIIQPRRAQIYVGFQCHQKCGFCYYKNRCNESMFTFDYIKKQIDFEIQYGIKHFEITGGEPSEYIRLIDVCEYIKNKCTDAKIAIITNGGLFLQNIWNIIDEILLSYHLSKKPTIYDFNIFPRGSTFINAIKTIEKAKQHNIVIRTNTVIGTFNIMDIDNIVNDIMSFEPQMINFLPVNLFDQAKSMEKYINYDIIRDILKKQIIKILSIQPNIRIAIRYMPFCDMLGFEQYIIGNVQHIYDYYDWNRELDGMNLLNIINNNTIEPHSLGLYGSTSIATALKSRKINYIKTRKCLTCKYYIICDGVEKTINNQFEKFIRPMRGPLIKNCLYYANNIMNKL